MQRRKLLKVALAGAALGITGIPIGRTLTVRAAGGGLPAPRLADVFYGGIYSSDVADLARYDLLTCSGEAVANNQFGAIKAANPNVKILPYQDTFAGLFSDPGGPLDTPGYTTAWQVKNSGGGIVYTGGVPLQNSSDLCPTNNAGQKWTDFMAQWVHDNYWVKGIGDGIFFDNSQNTISWISGDIDLDNNGDNDIAVNGSSWVDRHWEAGMQHLVQATRTLLGSNAIIMCNGPLYDNTWANGQLSEGFDNWEPLLGSNSYSANVTRYFDWDTNHYGQLYYILDQDPNATPSNQTNYQAMRYWLATTLLGDGYFNFSGPAGGIGYYQKWWYDEYSVNVATGQATGDASHKGYLGYATGGAVQLSNGVWRRDYDNGIALANPTGSAQTVTLETAYKRIQGSQDPTTNNGATVTNVILQSQDGLVLLRLGGTATPTRTFTATATATATPQQPTSTPTNTPKPSPSPTNTPVGSPSPTSTPTSTTNLALGKNATASSVQNASYPPSAAVDGNLSTRWSSAYADPQWLQVDLGAAYHISSVVLYWEWAYAKNYAIQVSGDGVNWHTVYRRTGGTGGTETLVFNATGRYVRMLGKVRGTQYGYSLWEFAINGNPNPVAHPILG